MIFKYKKYNIGLIPFMGRVEEGYQIEVGKDINPNARMPKVIEEAFEAYDYPNFKITFNELLEVCQEEQDNHNKSIAIHPYMIRKALFKFFDNLD
jgi:hypothetical protein